jgi:hypothetical protein
MDETTYDRAVAVPTKDANTETTADVPIEMADDSDEAPPPAPFIIAITPEPETTTLEITRSLPSEKTIIESPQSNKRPRSKTPSSPSSSSPAEDNKWQQILYSPKSGTTTTGADLLHKFERSGWVSPTAKKELEQYANYEFESFTFLQEIIPNLFLGRYVPLKASAVID